MGQPKGETREELKKRLFKKIDKVFENHLDNVQITGEDSESIYCKEAFIDHHHGEEIPDGCPEPQLLASYANSIARTLTIEISYVVNTPKNDDEDLMEKVQPKPKGFIGPGRMEK